MKILHISPFYLPSVGGGEVHMKELSERLVARGHDVTVLTTNVRSSWDIGLRRSGGLPDTENLNGVKIIRVNPNNGIWGHALDGWLKLKGGYRCLRLLLGADRLELMAQGFRMIPTIRHILRSDVDIVASMNWYCAPAYYAFLAGKLKNVTMIGIPLFHTMDAWADRAVHKRMLARCHAVIANTAHEASFIQKRVPIRTEVAGVGIHPAAFEHRDGAIVRKRYGLENVPVVGFVGRLIPRKGALTLVKAMPIVWKSNPEVRCVLAGSSPPQANEVDEFLSGLGAWERQRIIRIEEFPEQEKASIYDSFDIVALPSTSESFGIVYLEAWLCGKPVIGSRIGSTQSVIEEGVDGLLASPDDPFDLARAIVELLSNPEKRERLGKRGQAKTLARYTWDKVTEKVERIYLDLYTNKASAPSSSIHRKKHILSPGVRPPE